MPVGDDAPKEIRRRDVATRSYRYPGSPPFQDVAIDRRLFKGRDVEARTVLHSILSTDLFLLYAVSGMGKSSLLNAGVMHPLRERGYWPVSVRLNDPHRSPVEAIEEQIVEAARSDEQIDLVRTPGINVTSPATASLWDVLGSIEIWRQNRLQPLVVILDQFEELFTLDWPNDVRTRFITEFGEVIRGNRAVGESAGGTDGSGVMAPPDVKFVLVIREDALGELEALADDVPQVMQHRFRLGPLSAVQALAAIREPAEVLDAHLETQQFSYTEEAAEQILQFLQRTERAPTAMIAGASRAEQSVDPSQLQIICQYVERRVLPDKRPSGGSDHVEIEASDLGGVDGLRSILGDFYRRTVDGFPESVQKRIRELCERGLISPNQRRLSRDSASIDDGFEVGPAVLDELVDQRLLRAEPRVGSVYYELAHDTLVQPILADRLQRQRDRSRRRWRRAGIAAGIAAAAALLGVLAVVVSTGSDGMDETARTTMPEPAAVPLSFGGRETGTIGTAGTALFEITGGEAPSLIVVTPTDRSAVPSLNAAVSVTNTETGARRSQDQLGSGSAERMVIPAARGEKLTVAVTSDDQSTGPFEITMTDANAGPLVGPGSTPGPQPGSIDPAGSAVVYTVDSATSVAIDVVPDPDETRRGIKDKGLDVTLEVIDASGVGSRIDVGSAGESERTTLNGGSDPIVLVVRGYESSVGSFKISARHVERTVLVPGISVDGQLDPDDPPVEYAVAAQQGGLVAIVQPDEAIDMAMEVVGADGTSQFSDSGGPGGVEMVSSVDAGELVFRVVGFDQQGDFVVRAVEPRPLAVGTRETVPGSAAAFDVDVAGTDALVLTASPQSDTAVVDVRVFDPNGFVVASERSLQNGETVSLIVDDFDSEVPGTYRVAVASNEPDDQITAALEAVAPRLLASGATEAVTAPAVFDVAVDGDGLLVFTAAPDTDDAFVEVRIYDPDGIPTDFARSNLSGDPVAVAVDSFGAGLTGTYRLAVTSTEPNDQITASLDTVTARRLDVGRSDPVAAPAAFDVTAPPGEPIVFTAAPGTDDAFVDVTVHDPGGFPIASERSLDGGDPVAVVIGTGGGRFAGDYRVIVTSTDPRGRITPSVARLESVPLVAGTPVVTNAQAAFDVDVADGQLLVFTAQSTSFADLIDIQVSDPDGFAVAFGQSTSPGVPATVLISGEARSGRYQVIVNSTGAESELTATLDAIEPRSLTTGDGVVSTTSPAVFDIDVTDDQIVSVIADTDPTDSLLSLDVLDPAGFSTGDSAVFQPLPSVNELSPEIVALFPPAVRDLFADGLPATVDEAIAQLTDEGLLDEVIAVLSQNPEAADAFLAAPPTASADPALVSVQVGSGFPDRYRVVVTSLDRQSEIRVQLIEDSAPAD